MPSSVSSVISTAEGHPEAHCLRSRATFLARFKYFSLIAQACALAIWGQTFTLPKEVNSAWNQQDFNTWKINWNLFKESGGEPGKSWVHIDGSMPSYEATADTRHPQLSQHQGDALLQSGHLSAIGDTQHSGESTTQKSTLFESNAWPVVGCTANNGTYRHFSLDHNGNRMNTKVGTDAFDHIEDHDSPGQHLGGGQRAGGTLRQPGHVGSGTVFEREQRDAALKCYPRRGAGTRVFVIDTGCRATHEQLRGRVLAFASPGSRYTSGDDDHGHGTHVAATIAGRDFGVARRAKITCIKALSDKNTGTSGDVISAINHVIALKRRGERAGGAREAYVLSISLGVRAPRGYDALDRAVGRAARAGIVAVVAAGNAGGDACGFTPARAAGAVTVGALAGRALASFSNRGRCVAAAAPGVAVRSAFHAGDRAYARSSGTSMAAPRVSGLAALILGESPAARPRDVLREIRRDAARVVEGIPVATVRQTCPRR